MALEHFCDQNCYLDAALLVSFFHVDSFWVASNEDGTFGARRRLHFTMHFHQI